MIWLPWRQCWHQQMSELQRDTVCDISGCCQTDETVGDVKCCNPFVLYCIMSSAFDLTYSRMYSLCTCMIKFNVSSEVSVV